MREIKFRAWDKKEKKMLLPQYQNYWLQIGLEGIIYEFSNGRLLDTTIKPVKYSTREYPYELMQYTGLKDKNNKEIFEGDVVKWFSNRVEKAIVQFSNGIFQLKIQEPENDDYYMDILHNWTNTIEVIGNIYENPELLDN